MAITVRVPTALRRLTNNLEVVTATGGTVREVLAYLKENNAALAEQLVDANGKVRVFVNLYVNDEDIRFLDGLETTLADRDEVSIVPAIAGGL